MAARLAGLNLVQYIAVRGDLVEKWPVGAIIAQACHASTAVLHMFREDACTQQYLADLDRMHKVVLKVLRKKNISWPFVTLCDFVYQLLIQLTVYCRQTQRLI